MEETIIKIFYHSVRIEEDTTSHWHWCLDNLVTSDWYKTCGLSNNSSNYKFKNESDALMFKIMFPK